jgi:hypothetical protein
MTRETVLGDVPAAREISRIVTLRGMNEPYYEQNCIFESVFSIALFAANVNTLQAE